MYKNRGKDLREFFVCSYDASIRRDYEKKWKKMQAFLKGIMKKT